MATLTTKVTESIVLNGQNFASSHTKTIDSITQVIKSIIEIPTSEMNLLTFASAATGMSTLDQDDVEYVRITNLDSTNFITIGIETLADGDSVAAFRLDAGRSFILCTSNASAEHPQFFVNDSGHNSNGTQIDIETITALANTAACELEIFVALNTTT